MEEEDMVVITLKSLLVAIEHFIETLDILAIDKYIYFYALLRNILQQYRWKNSLEMKI